MKLQEPESQFESEDISPADFSEETSTFGDRLVAAREAAGMSQASLVQRLGISAGTLASWEEDREEPRSNKLQMLAGLLNVSIVWLLCGEGDGFDEAEVSTVDEQEDILEILAEIKAMRVEQMLWHARLGRIEKRLHGLLR